MSESGWLADQFEHWRPHLASVAYGMLGSVTEAQDAVQQAWLRLGRSDASAILGVAKVVQGYGRGPEVADPAVNVEGARITVDGLGVTAKMVVRVSQAVPGISFSVWITTFPVQGKGRRPVSSSRSRGDSRLRWGSHEVLQESAERIGPSFGRTGTGLGT